MKPGGASSSWSGIIRAQSALTRCRRQSLGLPKVIRGGPVVARDHREQGYHGLPSTAAGSILHCGRTAYYLAASFLCLRGLGKITASARNALRLPQPHFAISPNGLTVLLIACDIPRALARLVSDHVIVSLQSWQPAVKGAVRTGIPGPYARNYFPCHRALSDARSVDAEIIISSFRL
jgi:hypothetical protein